jgi:hypothetical protein
MGNYGNTLPGAILIKNNLILIVASEWTPSPPLLSFSPWRLEAEPSRFDKAFLLLIKLLTGSVW